MIGYVHITGAEIPEDLELEEDEETVHGFTIECDCVLNSRLETIDMVYNLAVALQFTEADWAGLELVRTHRGTREIHYQIGGIEEVEDESTT